MSRFRTKLHEPAIAAVAVLPRVLDALSDVGEEISDDVKSSTSSSRTVRPFGRMMSVEKSATGVRVGTSWGPAVPVEYGTARTPAHRILLSAAERRGRVEF